MSITVATLQQRSSTYWLNYPLAEVSHLFANQAILFSFSKSKLEESCHTKASKIRKCKDLRLPKPKPTALAPLSSDSWRTHFENMFSKNRSVLGQFQNDLEASSASLATRDAFYVARVASERDTLKSTWRSILACGKSLEKQLDLESPDSHRPLLSTVVTFVSHAYGLPVPESVFGAHHVMVSQFWILHVWSTTRRCCA